MRGPHSSGCRAARPAPEASADRIAPWLPLDAEFHPAGYNIRINDGTAAGQTVPHLHIHLIPRYEGDLTDPRGGVRWVLPEKAKYWP